MATRTTKAKTKSTSSASKKSTTKKATTKKATSSKSSTSSAPKAAPVVVDAPTPVVSGPMMRKKELIDAVATRSGLKRKDAKPAVEATLAALGEALQEGRSLNLHPFGKVKVKREKKLASGSMMVARIRQKGAGSDTSSEDAATPEVATDTAAE